MPSLAEELKNLTDRLEKILHEELPEAARVAIQLLGDNVSSTEALGRTVAELDQVQRVLGLRTFELLRRGPMPKISGSDLSLALAALVGDEGIEAGEPDQQAPRPAGGAKPGKGVPVEITCTFLNCHDAKVFTCESCSKPFCERHVDPAIHPCGDLL
jgi:hypothetical protein